ncbi:hypothetical protein C5167_039176, partial [Papaver somniferum]
LSAIANNNAVDFGGEVGYIKFLIEVKWENVQGSCLCFTIWSNSPQGIGWLQVPKDSEKVMLAKPIGQVWRKSKCSIRYLKTSSSILEYWVPSKYIITTYFYLTRCHFSCMGKMFFT